MRAFSLFLKSGRWGVHVSQHRRFCRNVPGLLSIYGNEDYCFLRDLSPAADGGEQNICVINDALR